MTESQTKKVTCPKCGKEYEWTIYPSINGNEDEDLKERLLNDELFRIECPHCHNVYMFSYPCVYTDREKKFMVYLLKEEDYPTLSNIDLPKEVKDSYTLRATFTLADFIEKVKILDDGVDDRVAEVAKIVCVAQFDKPEENIQYAEYSKREQDDIEVCIGTEKGRYGMRIAYPDLVQYVGLNDSFQMPRGFQIVNTERMGAIIRKEEEENKTLS